MRRPRMPIWGIFCHFSNCSGVSRAFICASVSSWMAFTLAPRSSGDRLAKSGSCRRSRIFCARDSMMDLNFGFWSSVRLSCWAIASRLGRPLMPGPPGGGPPAGGAGGGVLVALCAWSAGVHASRVPATSAVRINGLVTFINFASVVVLRLHRPSLKRWDVLSDAQGTERLQPAQHFRHGGDRPVNIRRSLRHGMETVCPASAQSYAGLRQTDNLYKLSLTSQKVSCQLRAIGPFVRLSLTALAPVQRPVAQVRRRFF